MGCGTCRGENPEGTRFCGHCGAPLRTALAETAELRQLTVLFCDLVGSTPMSESLEPEDLREVTSSWQAVCAAAIRRHDGYIAQYLGDGVLVYFGYPVAHEDDARRAVRAALEIVDDLKTISGRLHEERGLTLNARLGIHTGPVVVGDMGGGERREQLAVGMTPNLAARIQNIAAPGTVVVSDDTHAIVRGFFDFSALGLHEIKGLAKFVTLHRVLRESGAESRLDAQRRTGLTPLTGRNEELGLLKRLWSDVLQSGGHAMLLQGEAGVGKSRIVDSFREHVMRQSARVFESFCTPYAQSTPLFPIVGMLERILGFTRETTEAEKRAAISQRLARRGIMTQETSELVAGLLGIPPASGNVLANYSPQKLRERTLEILLAWLLAVAQEGPTLWVIEDMHWVDPTTLEFVSSALESSTSAPLLVLLTSRPNFTAPWQTDGRAFSMTLSGLAPAETNSIVMSVAHGKAIPEDVLSQIVARSEGIPLFVEEITKAVLELGVLVERENRFETFGPFPPGLIPSTVQGSLTARLDRLGSAKAIAQVAATIGREFSFALLSAVAEDSEAVLRRGLERLTGAELLSRIEELPEETYLFKHALVRDAAYQSLLKKSRRALHQRIAEALTSRFPEISSKNPELVAEHFSAAGSADQAVKFWLLAGQQAVGRAANHEAIVHLNRGLDLVGELPPAEGHRQELELLMALFPAVIAAEGWASPKLGKAYGRAAELVKVLGETPERFMVLSGTMGYHFVAGRVELALGLARETLELAKKIGSPVYLTMGHQNCSAVYNWHGDFRLSVEHAEAGRAMFDIERERFTAQMMGLSPCVGIAGYEYVAWWMLGFPERSRKTAEYGRALAQEVGHLPSIGFALTVEVGSLYLQGDGAGIVARSDEALQFVRKERLGFYEPYITSYRLGLSLDPGGAAEASAQIRGAIERYCRAGNGNNLIWFYAILASAQWRAGEWDDAFGTLATAMALAAETGEGLYEPELYRLKGDFLYDQAIGAAGPSQAASGDDLAPQFAAAEDSIRESLALAQRQEARMLELRSLTSLCRVRRELGAVSRERDMLADLYQTFTEGFDTPDLCAARAMIETLKA
ncbi:MAG TPA: adenylate/guanylate cyclase domain-containing protein [Bryobacteraceae bacterium]|nr:adenylate/guanylate cyclase domain-containing protein [Bryobacteraceae bacterium]